MSYCLGSITTSRSRKVKVSVAFLGRHVKVVSIVQTKLVFQQCVAHEVLLYLC